MSMLSQGDIINRLSKIEKQNSLIIKQNDAIWMLIQAILSQNGATDEQREKINNIIEEKYGNLWGD